MMLGDLKNLLRRRNAFDLTHEKKLTMNFFALIPFFVEDVVPGDTFKVSTEMLIRLAPQLAPVMHRVYVYTHFFFVPNRLVWIYDNATPDFTDAPRNSGWERFISSQDDVGNYVNVSREPYLQFRPPNPDPLPGIVYRSPTSTSIYDYLYGFAYPEADSYSTIGQQQVSALPLRGYALIWNEWYRDGMVQTPLMVHYGSGSSGNPNGEDNRTWTYHEGTHDSDPWVDLNKPVKRNWEKDYFTTCRPSPQLGPAATVPLGSTKVAVDFQQKSQASLGTYPRLRRVNSGAVLQGNATTFVYPVVSNGALTWSLGPQVPTVSAASEATGTYVTIQDANTTTGHEYRSRTVPTGSTWYTNTTDRMYQGGDPNEANGAIGYDPNGTLIVDFAKATAGTINDLRLGFQLQKFMERSMRAGARYVETILAHFGVRVPDGRLQRPEFLGGGKSPVIFSEVLQTSQTASSSPQGNMAGHGFSALKSHGFHKTFTEHGWIIGLVSVLPRTSYQNGIARRFDRRGYADYYWPEFSHIGEQSVYNSEIFALSGTQRNTFGYQARYDEYRHRQNSVHGYFRDSLNYWHMGRDFTTMPALNTEFLIGDEATPNRVFTVPSSKHHLWVQLVNHCTAIRPIPRRGEPGLVDHF